MANAFAQAPVTAATSVNSPTSVTPTLGVASAKGNLLLITVFCTGSSPSITTPAGWTLISSAANAVAASAIFAILNNSGGITAVAITISATNGGAVATIYEVAATGLLSDTSLENNYNSNLWGSAPFFSLVTEINELDLITIGVIAANTITTTAQGDFKTITGPTSSTTATTNAQKIDYLSLNCPFPQYDTPGGSVSGGGQNISYLEARFITSQSTPVARGAGGGVFVGNSGNPAGPLQVPQPITYEGSGGGSTGGTG
jgi:hypothetical protein